MEWSQAFITGGLSPGLPYPCWPVAAATANSQLPLNVEAPKDISVSLLSQIYSSLTPVGSSHPNYPQELRSIIILNIVNSTCWSSGMMSPTWPDGSCSFKYTRMITVCPHGSVPSWEIGLLRPTALVTRNIHSESGSLGVMVRSTKPTSALGSQVCIFYLFGTWNQKQGIGTEYSHILEGCMRTSQSAIPELVALWSLPTIWFYS